MYFLVVDAIVFVVTDGDGSAAGIVVSSLLAIFAVPYHVDFAFFFLLVLVLVFIYYFLLFPTRMLEGDRFGSHAPLPTSLARCTLRWDALDVIGVGSVMHGLARERE